MKKNIQELETLARQTRRDILRMVHAVNSGHPGGSLGAVEFFIALYYTALHYNPSDFQMDGKEEDLFFLSNGHISPVYYSVLARAGFFPSDELNSFRKLNARLQGHPTTHEGLPGIRIASGSLGQGMSVALGAAQAKKLNQDDRLIYSLHGDGELQEGQIWEAVLYAGSKGIDNYIATIDYNQQQIDGSLNEVLPLGDLAQKFHAFGWHLIEQKQGNVLSAVIETLKEAKNATRKGKPVVILLHTEMGYGVDFMQGTHHWHGKAPNDKQLQKALLQLSKTDLGDF